LPDFKTASDEHLMKSYQLGSEPAFDILFQRYAGKVLGFLKKRALGKKVQDDLLQEVFLKLHRSKHLYNSTLPFSPWLFSITRSVLLDSLKKKNLEDPTDVNDFNQVAAVADDSESQVDLTQTLANLPASQQQVIQMRVYDEKTFEEIASRLSTSPENARQLFSRGIKKIRTLLGRKD
jgi:RNA polymerase sigma factor (sigma-70 family)